MADKQPLPKSLVEALPHSRFVVKNLRFLEKELEEVAEQMADLLKRGNAIQLARAFVVLHRLNDEMVTLNRQFTALFDKYKKELLPQAFEHEGVTSVPLAEGFRVGVSSKFYASIKPDMKSDAYAWLRDHGLADIVTETVNASTLSAAAKHMVEEENRELPDDLFTTAWVPNTSVTGTGK